MTMRADTVLSDLNNQWEIYNYSVTLNFFVKELKPHCWLQLYSETKKDSKINNYLAFYNIKI